MLTKIKQILFSPTEFFKKVSNEKGLVNPFKFIAVVSAFYFFLMFTVSYLIGTTQFDEFIKSMPLDLPIWATVLLIIFLIYILSLGLSFVSSFLLFVWLRIFKGKRPYQDAYRLNAYSNAGVYVFGWIPFIGGFAFIYSLVLLIIGTKSMYKFSTLKSTLIYVIPIIVILLIIIFFMVAILAWSLSSLQPTPGF